MPLTPEQTEPVLDREAIAAIDPTDQLTDVLALPEHVRDALWKADSAGLARGTRPAG
jgi:glucose/mannose-6-phosphate isomerase